MLKKKRRHRYYRAMGVKTRQDQYGADMFAWEISTNPEGDSYNHVDLAYGRRSFVDHWAVSKVTYRYLDIYDRREEVLKYFLQYINLRLHL